MTPDQLRELLEKATPGPWRWIKAYGPNSGSPGHDAVEGDEGRLVLWAGNDDNVVATESDETVIVALRNLAPHLLALWGAAERLDVRLTLTDSDHDQAVLDLDNALLWLKKS